MCCTKAIEKAWKEHMPIPRPIPQALYLLYFIIGFLPSTPTCCVTRGNRMPLTFPDNPQPWARVLTQAVGCLPGPMVLRAEPAEACISSNKASVSAGSAGKWMCGIVNTSQSLAGENEPQTEDRDSKLLPVVLCRRKHAAFYSRGLGCLL